MARYPGTEKHTNRSGLAPGDSVRCLRTASNADLKLADRRGVVTEVRPGNVSVLFDPTGGSKWLANDAVAREAEPGDGDLQLIASALRILRAERLELDEDESELVVFSAEYPASALDEVRALLGPRLSRCEIRAAGVHEVATHLRWRRTGVTRKAGATGAIGASGTAESSGASGAG